MANEITVSLNLSVKNPSDGSGYNATIRQSGQLTQNALGVNAETISVPTIAAAYTFTNLATYGFLFIQNLDATNYVDYGVNATGFQPVGRLKPGEWAFLRLTPGISFMMQAHTAAVNVSYSLFND